MYEYILQLKEEVQALFKTFDIDLCKLERENKKYGCVFLTGTFCVEMSYRRRRCWHPTPVLLPEKSHGRRRLVGCSPWGHKESDMTERLHFHFSLSCIGEGNGNPLQCSCLENPRDGGAWGAAVYGVAQSWTRLKRLRSNSRATEAAWSEGIMR